MTRRRRLNPYLPAGAKAALLAPVWIMSLAPIALE